MTRRLSAFIISVAVVTYIAQFPLRSQNNSFKAHPRAGCTRIPDRVYAADKEPTGGTVRSAIGRTDRA
jgi:hypothetical protein